MEKENKAFITEFTDFRGKFGILKKIINETERNIIHKYNKYICRYVNMHSDLFSILIALDIRH